MRQLRERQLRRLSEGAESVSVLDSYSGYDAEGYPVVSGAGGLEGPELDARAWRVNKRRLQAVRPQFATVEHDWHPGWMSEDEQIAYEAVDCNFVNTKTFTGCLGSDCDLCKVAGGQVGSDLRACKDIYLNLTSFRRCAWHAGVCAPAIERDCEWEILPTTTTTPAPLACDFNGSVTLLIIRI